MGRILTTLPVNYLRMKGLGIGVAAGVLVALFGAVPAIAQEPDTTRVRENLQSTTTEMEASVARQKQLEAEVSAAIKAEEDVSSRLVEAGRGIASLEDALAATERRLKELDAERIGLAAELASKQDVLSELLAALQRLEQNPPPALVVAPDDILQALRGAMMFGAVVPEMREQAALLTNKLERLASITRETETAQTDAKTQIQTLAEAYRGLEILQREKQVRGVSASASLEAERKLSNQLGKQAKNLQQLLASLETVEAERAKALSEEQARAEKERERQLAALQRPKLSLSKARGRLDYPVQGQIVARFGDDTGLGSVMNGLAIATRGGTQVRSPVDGRIEFAGPFRSYGQVLIIEAGEDYLVLLAGLEQISPGRGQNVRMGEPVGFMGHGPSSAVVGGKAAASLTPVLYVEFRKSGKPIDSAAWWVGSRKEAKQ